MTNHELTRQMVAMDCSPQQLRKQARKAKAEKQTPLTEAEHVRLAWLLACQPCQRHPVDARLISLGLAEDYDGDDTATDVRWEVVGDRGSAPYYLQDGSGCPDFVRYPFK